MFKHKEKAQLHSDNKQALYAPLFVYSPVFILLVALSVFFFQENYPNLLVLSCLLWVAVGIVVLFSCKLRESDYDTLAAFIKRKKIVQFGQLGVVPLLKASTKTYQHRRVLYLLLNTLRLPPGTALVKKTIFSLDERDYPRYKIWQKAWWKATFSLADI